jgi:hypothetical protein
MARRGSQRSRLSQDGVTGSIEQTPAGRRGGAADRGDFMPRSTRHGPGYIPERSGTTAGRLRNCYESTRSMKSQ